MAGSDDAGLAFAVGFFVAAVVVVVVAAWRSPPAPLRSAAQAPAGPPPLLSIEVLLTSAVLPRLQDAFSSVSWAALHSGLDDTLTTNLSHTDGDSQYDLHVQAYFHAKSFVIDNFAIQPAVASSGATLSGADVPPGTQFIAYDKSCEPYSAEFAFNSAHARLWGWVQEKVAGVNDRFCLKGNDDAAILVPLTETVDACGGKAHVTMNGSCKIEFPDLPRVYFGRAVVPYHVDSAGLYEMHFDRAFWDPEAPPSAVLARMTLNNCDSDFYKTFQTKGHEDASKQYSDEIAGALGGQTQQIRTLLEGVAKSTGAPQLMAAVQAIGCSIFDSGAGSLTVACSGARSKYTL